MEKKIGFVTHPDFSKHYATYNHPECPERTQVLRELVENSPLRECIDIVIPQQAEMEYITEVHPIAYLERLRVACERGNFWFDYEDTYINTHSYDTAIFSAGGSIEGVNLALTDRYNRVFCCIRPPGHHATGERGMGFCLLNNIAIAAKYAKKKFGINKIMIIDWDVHHGNGTQFIFEADPSVYYISIHEHPTFIFPGTGRRWERGSGKGKEYTMNIPLPPGAGDDAYIQAMESLIIPCMKTYAPELILISAGFDAHRDDPLSDMMVTEEGFRRMTALTVKASTDFSTGKVVSILEGGYDLAALKESVHAHLDEMIFPEKEEKCLFIEE